MCMMRVMTFAVQGAVWPRRPRDGRCKEGTDRKRKTTKENDTCVKVKGKANIASRKCVLSPGPGQNTA